LASGFGGVWYNVLSKQWLEAVGRQPGRMHERGGVGLYVLALVAQLIMAWMLAGILLHLATGRRTILGTRAPLRLVRWNRFGANFVAPQRVQRIAFEIGVSMSS
jgi:hypothetical protein